MKEDTALERLEAADWRRIIHELAHYAYRLAQRYPWRSGSHKILPEGKTPEDVAVEAIEKLWNGERDWDPEKYPDLLLHLKWIVRSDMGHLYRSSQHLKTRRFPETGSGTGEPFNPGESGDSRMGEEPPAGSLDPEAELILREQQELELRVKAELYAAVEGDEDLELLLLCFEEGLDKPEAIAAQMGWEISKVYNLKKRLLRKAAALGKTLPKESPPIGRQGTI